jgi:ribonuclease Z
MDCGEGTYGQLFRKFGPEKLGPEFLAEVKLLFISHMHADHHIGAIKLLIERRRVCDDCFLIV